MVELKFIAPNRPLSENESRRMHWAQRSKRLSEWKLMTMVYYKKLSDEDKKKLHGKKIKITVTLPFKTKSRRDAHNYISTNIKTIIDALVKCQMIPDDTSDYIEVIEPKLLPNSIYCIIKLEPIGDYE